MQARWDLNTTAEGLEVRYTNLLTAESMFCGVTDDTLPALIEFMQHEGGEGSSFVVLDGEVIGWWLSAETDEPNTWNFPALQGAAHGHSQPDYRS